MNTVTVPNKLMKIIADLPWIADAEITRNGSKTSITATDTALKTVGSYLRRLARDVMNSRNSVPSHGFTASQLERFGKKTFGG
jgi:hypothetical protein